MTQSEIQLKRVHEKIMLIAETVPGFTKGK